jgi:hypothetical protein
MSTCKRHGKKWTVNEVIALQREYELLELTVQDIADRHLRTVKSIMFKLHAEGLISSLNEARGFTTSNQNDNKVVNKKHILKVSHDNISDTDSSSDYNDDDQTVSDFSISKSSLDIETDMNSLSDRVWSLETSVNQIGTMVKQIFDEMTSKKNTKKLKPLRKM